MPPLASSSLLSDYVLPSSLTHEMLNQLIDLLRIGSLLLLKLTSKSLHCVLIGLALLLRALSHRKKVPHKLDIALSCLAVAVAEPLGIVSV